MLGIARHRLGDVHAAEDVFQSTFLALARRAVALRVREPLEGWLYTVAYRLARKEEVRTARGRAAAGLSATRESRTADPLAAVTGRELPQVIDDELAALPSRYRLPLLLCGIHRPPAFDPMSGPNVTHQAKYSLPRCHPFTPDGRRLVSTSRDLTGLAWDVSAARPAQP